MKDTIPFQDVVIPIYNRMKIDAIYNYLPLMSLVSSNTLHAISTQIFVEWITISVNGDFMFMRKMLVFLWNRRIN